MFKQPHERLRAVRNVPLISVTKAFLVVVVAVDEHCDICEESLRNTARVHHQHPKPLPDSLKPTFKTLRLSRHKTVQILIEGYLKLETACFERNVCVQ